MAARLWLPQSYAAKGIHNIFIMFGNFQEGGEEQMGRAGKKEEGESETGRETVRAHAPLFCITNTPTQRLPPKVLKDCRCFSKQLYLGRNIYTHMCLLWEKYI